jgi:hypothetical protein
VRGFKVRVSGSARSYCSLVIPAPPGAYLHTQLSHTTSGGAELKAIEVMAAMALGASFMAISCEASLYAAE